MVDCQASRLKRFVEDWMGFEDVMMCDQGGRWEMEIETDTVPDCQVVVDGVRTTGEGRLSGGVATRCSFIELNSRYNGRAVGTEGLHMIIRYSGQ